MNNDPNTPDFQGAIAYFDAAVNRQQAREQELLDRDQRDPRRASAAVRVGKTLFVGALASGALALGIGGAGYIGAKNAAHERAVNGTLPEHVEHQVIANQLSQEHPSEGSLSTGTDSSAP